MTNDRRIVFVVGSCQYPAGLLDQQLAEVSYRRMASRIRSADIPEGSVLLLLGDQIYADASAGLLGQSSWAERYAQRYTAAEAISSVAVRHLRVMTMLDDHELNNDWEPHSVPLWQQYLEHGRNVYSIYGRGIRSRPLQPKEPLYYTFTWDGLGLDQGGLPFFVADSRTEREHRTATSAKTAHIFSGTQMQALKDWLVQPDHQALPKFIAMPAMLLPRRLATRSDPSTSWRSDAWDGYPASLHSLLGFIAHQQIQRVVFLSGDEHLACRAEITLTAPKLPPVRAWSFHSPGLYAPYPFSNALPHDFPDEDEFDFDYPAAEPGKTTVGCRVTAEFPDTGHGYLVVKVDGNPHTGFVLEVDVDAQRRPPTTRPTWTVTI